MILDYFPVLAYHKISPQNEFGLTTVTPETFDKQLQIIQQSGFTPLTFNDLQTWAQLPEKPIIITFDDGYESIYHHALPALIKYSFKAVVYVLSDFIGKINTWEAYKIQRRFRHLSNHQLREMVNLGIEFGSHGRKHKYLRSLDNGELYDEIMISKKELSGITDHEIISFCYPYGLSNQRIEKIVKECGYRFAVSNLKFATLKHHHSYCIGRRSIYSTDTLRIFKEKLSQPSLLHTSLFTEKIIKLGASASIIKKYLNK